MGTLIYSKKIEEDGRTYYCPPVSNQKSNGKIFSCPMVFEQIGNDFKSVKIEDLTAEHEDPFIHYQIEWSKLPKEDGKVTFNTEELFKDFFSIIPEHIRIIIRENKLRVVISDMLNHNSVVGDLGDDNLILEIQKSADKYDIPGDQVKFISGDYTTPRRWKKYIKDNDIDNPISCGYVCLQGTSYRHSDPFETDKLQEPAEREIEKVFLSLNRKPRIQRVLFLLLLEKYDILDLGFVSALEKVNVVPAKLEFSDLIKILKERDAPNNKSILDDELFEHAEAVREKLPLILDIENLADVKPLDAGYIEQTAEYYNKSFISVIIESTYRNCGTYLTQNVFKSIVAKHPFMIVGQKGVIKNLQHLGFKTFNDFIDEKYDNKTHYVRRVDAMVNELVKFANLHKDDLKKVLLKMEDVLNYNHHYFYNGFQDLVNEQIEKEIFIK